MRAALKALGVGNRCGVRLRMRRLGETAEEAIEAFLNNSARSTAVVVCGVQYPSAASAIRAHGVNSGNVWRRVKRYGETFEEAICAIGAHRGEAHHAPVKKSSTTVSAAAGLAT